MLPLQVCAYGKVASCAATAAGLQLNSAIVLVGAGYHFRTAFPKEDLFVFSVDGYTDLDVVPGRLGQTVSASLCHMLRAGEQALLERTVLPPAPVPGPFPLLGVPLLPVTPPFGQRPMGRFDSSPPVPLSPGTACGVGASASALARGALPLVPGVGALALARGALPLAQVPATAHGVDASAPARGVLPPAPAPSCARGVGASAMALPRGAVTLPQAQASVRGAGAFAAARARGADALALPRGAPLPAADERAARKRPAVGHGGDARSDRGRSFSSPFSLPSSPRPAFSNEHVDAAVLSRYGAGCHVFF